MIVGATWCFLENFQLKRDYGILIYEKKIVDVGMYSRLCIKYPKEVRLFCDNSVMVPALYNLHQHLEFSVFHNGISSSNYFQWINQLSVYKHQMTSLEKKISYQYGLIKSTLHGVGYIMDNVSSLDMYKEFSDSGLNGYLMYELTGKSGNIKEKLKKIIAEELSKERKKSGPSVGLACHTLYTCESTTIKNVLEIAKEFAIKSSIHISETQMEYDCFRGENNLLRSQILKRRRDLLQDGSPIQFLFNNYGTLISEDTFLVHCTYMDSLDLELINDYKTKIILCPESNLLLSHGISPASKLISQYNNVRIGFGTDSFASCRSMSLLNQVYLYNLLNNIVNPEIALNDKVLLKLLTCNAARLVNENERGTIKVGNYADIVCFEIQEDIQNNLLCHLISRNNAKCILNIVNGKILYKYGEFFCFDVERNLSDIKKIREKYAL